MKNSPFIYCLKVSRKDKKDTDYYYREDLEDIRSLMYLLKRSYPKFLYNVIKVKSLPINDKFTLNVEETLFLERKF